MCAHLVTNLPYMLQLAAAAISLLTVLLARR